MLLSGHQRGGADADRLSDLGFWRGIGALVAPWLFIYSRCRWTYKREHVMGGNSAPSSDWTRYIIDHLG
jgi:hypothetical protein